MVSATRQGGGIYIHYIHAQGRYVLAVELLRPSVPSPHQTRNILQRQASATPSTSLFRFIYETSVTSALFGLVLLLTLMPACLPACLPASAHCSRSMKSFRRIYGPSLLGGFPNKLGHERGGNSSPLIPTYSQTLSPLEYQTVQIEDARRLVFWALSRPILASIALIYWF